MSSPTEPAATTTTTTPTPTPAAAVATTTPVATPVVETTPAAATATQTPAVVTQTETPAVTTQSPADLFSMVNGLTGSLVVAPTTPAASTTATPAVTTHSPATPAAAAAITTPTTGVDGLVYDENGMPRVMPVQTDAGMSFLLQGAKMDWADARKWDPETQKKLSEYGALSRQLAIGYTKTTEEKLAMQKELETAKAAQKEIHDKLKEPLEDLTKSRELASKFLTDFVAANANNKDLKTPTNVSGTIDVLMKQNEILKRQLLETSNKVLALEGKELVMQTTSDYASGSSSAPKRHAGQDSNNPNQPVNSSAQQQQSSNGSIPPQLMDFLVRSFTQQPVSRANMNTGVPIGTPQSELKGWSKANMGGKTLSTHSLEDVCSNLYANQARALYSHGNNFSTYENRNKPSNEERSGFNNFVGGSM